MTRLNDLLHDANAGLLPYLQTRIAADFNHLIIRQYSFGSAAQRTGYRIRSIRTEIEDSKVHWRTASVAIGRLIDISTDQDYQIVAGDFANALSDAITDWSRCKAPGVRKPVTEIDANLAPVQNPGITGASTNPASWAIAVILSLEIEFWD
jgi:hypothetical protein